MYLENALQILKIGAIFLDCIPYHNFFGAEKGVMYMLTLSRRKGESVFIEMNGQKIQVLLINIQGKNAKIGFICDSRVKIKRSEIVNDKTRTSDSNSLPNHSLPSNIPLNTLNASHLSVSSQ